MKLRLFSQLIIPFFALIPLGTLHAQAQGPGMQEMAIGSALFAAGEKAELLIAQSMARNAPSSAESSLVIRDAKGDTLATVDLSNLAAYVAPSEDGIMRWINAVTVEVSSGILVVNGQAYAAIEEDGATSTPFFSNYRPQFYFRTTDVTGSSPQVTLNILGPSGGTRATRSVSDGYWIMLPPLTPSADTATPVSVPPTESIAFTYRRIERSSSAPTRSESAALMFVDSFGQTLGSVDLPDGDSGTIAAAVDGGVLTVNGEALGPLVTDPNTGRLSFGFYIMLDNQGANAVDGASARRSITITVYDQAGGETRSTYNCQLVDGQLPPGLTITGCAT